MRKQGVGSWVKAPMSLVPFVAWVLQTYSGVPLIRTPLGPSASGRIIEVYSSRELLIEHVCGLSLKWMMQCDL